jgi:hypothetical protein
VTAKLLAVLRLLVIAYVAWAALVWIFQRELLFPRRGLPQAESMVEALGGERWWLELPDGRVEAWFLPAPTEGPAPAVIFAHGNAELIDHLAPLVTSLRTRGASLLLVEYPGYGRSEGSPTQGSIEAAFEAAHARLVARDDVDDSRLAYFGRSLGSGAVCRLAAAHPPAALVLQSPFTSVRSFASGFLLPGFLVRDPFDNLAVVSTLDAPVLVAHGTRDRVVPVAHGRAVAEAARDGRLSERPAGHNDMPPDPTAYWAEVAAFLTEAGVLTAAP